MSFEGLGEVTRPIPAPRTLKALRQRNQRRVHRERLAREDLRRRMDLPDLLPMREDEARYRP